MKIGITLNMSVAFWANGMQQNIVFLYSLLSRSENDCYYITHEEPKYSIHKNHKGMVLRDLLSDESEVFDILFVAGFDLTEEMYIRLKKRNKNLKIILIHYGNKLLDDMSHGISGPENRKSPIFASSLVDEIWTSPHYEFSLPYLRTYYKNENVRIAPYIWDSFFVDEKVKELRLKNLDPSFNPKKVNQVCVFEPNKTHSKNALIPIMICERFSQLFGDELQSINIFCAEKIRKRQFFCSFIQGLNIGKKKDYMFFNNRWSSLDASAKFGSTVISHQINNELNYSHFESLYLGLPLIHNSEMLQDVGYYYPEFDVNMGAKQLKNAILNHSKSHTSYIKDCNKFLESFSPYSQQNINQYNSLLNE